jgi:hypothetical protein
MSIEEQKKFSAYTKNNTAYTSVMTAYEQFIGKSSFSNVVAAPNMGEILKTTN